MNNLPKICLGAWAWGNDGTFGNVLTEEMLKPVFDRGMKYNPLLSKLKLNTIREWEKEMK